MFEKPGLTRMAQALAAHASARLEAVAGNVANADTPRFRAKDVPDFAKLYEDRSFAMQSARAGHLFNAASTGVPLIPSGDGMAPNGNDVSIDMQMMKAAAARQSHEMALAVYQNTSDIIRTSLGRST